jgi:excisionase family DNA binding protein
VIVVVTPDPRDAVRVAGALGLLDRYLRANGGRGLPANLREPVVHADTASDRPQPPSVHEEAAVSDAAAVPLLLTYRDAASRLRASERTVQRLVADGALPTRRIGRRSYIAPADLQRYVDDLPAERGTA